VLGESTSAVLSAPNRNAHEIFGSPDDLKFRSSITLFDAVGEQGIFRKALDRFYQGMPDQATMDALRRWDCASRT
jgi:uncharacterized protein (DUF1810 family)